MTKVLVVYYSRTGHTRQIAEAIASACGGDLEAILEPRSRMGVFGFIRSVIESLWESVAEIAPSKKSPGDYDLVILGTPVWAGNMSSPMRAYIRRYRERLPRVAFFCSLIGANPDKALPKMAAACGKDAAATLEVRESELQAGAHTAKISDFLKSIEL
ncbi:MAG: flavodoxin [Alphaproteobacteria bacterium]|nr:flavodoxin [Alphaproteobacteria bacterium]